jgi:hypothetical protein
VEGLGPMIAEAGSWLNGKIGRKGDKTYRLRFGVQTGFTLVCVLLGLEELPWTP